MEYLKNNKIGLNTYSTCIHLAPIFILVFQGFLRIFRIVLWHGILCKMIFLISDSIVEINLPTSYIKLYIEADNYPNEIFIYFFFYISITAKSDFRKSISVPYQTPYQNIGMNWF